MASFSDYQIRFFFSEFKQTKKGNTYVFTPSCYYISLPANLIKIIQLTLEHYTFHEANGTPYSIFAQKQKVEKGAHTLYLDSLNFSDH